MLQPTRLISTPFAQEGEKTEIQNVTGEFDNSATYRLGFPPLTMQSIRLGGKPPKGTDFNGVLFDITENISFLCKGGRYQYNAGLSTLIGGYPEGSNLLLDDNVTEVVSTVAGNQNNPNTDMTGWTFKPNRTTAEYVLDASGETQQQVNYNGGSKWHSRVGGYLKNERVVLANGDIVKSTIDGNTNDPNVNMTGWEKDGGVSATPSILTGATNTPNVTEFYQWNKITTSAAASKTDAGTNQQPNLIGWNVNLSEQAADGTTSVFTVANTFPVVLDPAKEIVRVALIRLSDGVRFPQVSGTHYSINVSGDNTVTVTFNTAPQNIYSVWIRVIGSTQNSNSPLLNFITNGYDNVTDGAGPMLEMTGAHHTELNNPGGHNTYAGGSYNQMINGCSYSLVGGHENHLEGVAFGFVLGGRNTLKTSSGAAVFGQNNKISNSTGVLAGGYDHNFDGKPYTVVGGRGAIPIASGGLSIGNNKSGDTRAGLRQFDIFGLSKTTTDATEGFLSQISGASLNILNVTSAAFVTAEVIATTSDNANQKTFMVKACVKRVGGVVSIIGAPLVVSDFETVGASAWSLRFQAASNGFYLRPTGEAGKTIRWMATVKVTSSAFDAA